MHIQSKATKYATELKGVVETLFIVEVAFPIIIGILSVGLASFRWHELYSGLFTELGNLNNDDRLQEATAEGFADSTKGNVR